MKNKNIPQIPFLAVFLTGILSLVSLESADAEEKKINKVQASPNALKATQSSSKSISGTQLGNKKGDAAGKNISPLSTAPHTLKAIQPPSTPIVGAQLDNKKGASEPIVTPSASGIKKPVLPIQAVTPSPIHTNVPTSSLPQLTAQEQAFLKNPGLLADSEGLLTYNPQSSDYKFLERAYSFDPSYFTEMKGVDTQLQDSADFRNAADAVVAKARQQEAKAEQWKEKRYDEDERYDYE